MIQSLTRFIVFMAMLVMPQILFSQCFVYPVSFTERVNNAHSLLLGKVTEQHCYTDESGNIYTSNKVSVTAWIKNLSNETEIYVITLGGIMNGAAQITYPAVQLQKDEEYFLMLENDNLLEDDKSTRTLYPNRIQALPFADAQGVWLLQDGKYHDVFTEALSETELLQKLSAVGLHAKTPAGEMFVARTSSARTNKTAAITSMSPNPTNAGTVNPADYLTINGSGFGTTQGTVEFANADNGGSTFITPPNSTDYVSWSDNQIVVKVPTDINANAGSGFVRVNGTMTSPNPLTINYSHISVNNIFSGFASETRQRYYLRNIDGLGGYSFVYNTGFASNSAAVAAFERALNTWKCNTGINWKSSGTTSVTYDADNISAVMFDASLPAGVLARATSRFSGSAIPGSCDLQNTVWWAKEIDMQVQPGINWQYGPANAVPGQYDFETVVLHELGHAHGLGHRIAPGQLMNYSLGSGTNIRTPGLIEVQGAQAKMAYSTAPTCFNPTGSGTPMIAANCSFPVKLVSFTGALKNYGAELNWKTENEINSDLFEVQRSSNGVEFISIGYVAAKGNASLENDYHFVDATVQQGINYYRLKMIDKDRSFEYSNVVIIKAEALKLLSVYPNPVKNELQISSSVKTILNIIDGNGKLVKKVQVDVGKNKLNVSDLSNGIYYLSDEVRLSKTRIIIIH